MASHYVNVDNAMVSLHQGWVHHKPPQDSKWRNGLLRLDGRVLNFYIDTTQTHPFVSLKISDDFKFEKREGSQKTGYKFDISVNQTAHKFKACKFSEREQWKAYLEGVATGKVSDEIDLPSDYLRQIRDALVQIQVVSDSTLVPQQSFDDSEYAYSSTGSFTASDYDDSDSGCGDPQYYIEPVPNMGLVFYEEQNRTDLPSWFFPNCSREQAVQILMKGAHYGNTLMRKGATNNSNLVISKRMETGNESFTHYEVITLPYGYKLNVENPHRPMKTLTAIMNFFVQTSGILTTLPMKSNNWNEIGFSPDHDYNPCIISSFERSLADFSKPVKPTAPSPSHNQIWTQQAAGQRAAHWNQRRSQSIPDLKPGILQLQERRKLSADVVTMGDDISKASQTALSRQIQEAFGKLKPRSLDIPPPPPLNPPPSLNSKNNVNVPPPPPLNPPPSLNLKNNVDVPPPPPVNSPPSRTPKRNVNDPTPPLPPNHPPKLTTPPIKQPITPSVVSTPVSTMPSLSVVKDKQLRETDGETNSMIGDVPREDFKMKLNAVLFGGNKLAKTDKSHAAAAVVATPPVTSNTTENMLQDYDPTYQNTSQFKRQSVYNN